MPDCNSGIRVKFVRGGGIPRIWVRDESKARTEGCMAWETTCILS